MGQSARPSGEARALLGSPASPPPARRAASHPVVPTAAKPSRIRRLRRSALPAVQFLGRVTRQLIAFAEAAEKPFNTTVGRHTYGVSARTIFLAPSANPPSVSIGHFCSFAPGVVILANADHPKNLPSTYPFRTMLFRKGEALPYSNFDAVSRGGVTIGHDVWVGQDALILSGVTVGTGAIIGAGAVVTRDVPPYGIAVGTPAKVVALRFAPATIERLLASEWWNLSDEELQSLDAQLYSEDIDGFLVAVARLRSRGATSA